MNMNALSIYQIVEFSLEFMVLLGFINNRKPCS